MRIIDLIGNTPLMNIKNIFFKMEMMNPSGSIKDRVAKEMIFPYLSDVHKKFTVVEATSGNTGISVAMVCASLGLECVIVCPTETSRLKMKLMLNYGADVIFTPTIKQAIGQAKQIVRWNNEHTNDKYIYLDQFNNLYNIEAQKKMAKEVAMWFKPDAIVAGTGTGGTLMGLHTVFPKAELYEVRPQGKIEGITDCVKQSLIPDNLERNKVYIPAEDAIEQANRLMHGYGISCGYSSGANYLAALMVHKKYNKVLTIFPDNRIRYL